MNTQDFPSNGKRITLLSTYPILTAVTGVTPGSPNGPGAGGVSQLVGIDYAGFEATFVYAAGGTTVKAWVQTSFDGGANWLDIVNFAFTTASLRKNAAVSTQIVAVHATPTTATLADNTVVNGLLGDRLRVVVTTTGTYTGVNTLTINAIVKG